MTDDPAAVHGLTGDVQFSTPPESPPFTPDANAEAAASTQHLLLWLFDAAWEDTSVGTTTDSSAPGPDEEATPSHTWTTRDRDTPPADQRLTPEPDTTLAALLAEFDEAWQLSVKVNEQATDSYYIGAQRPVGGGFAYRLAVSLTDGFVDRIEVTLPRIWRAPSPGARKPSVTLNPPVDREGRLQLLKQLERHVLAGHLEAGDALASRVEHVLTYSERPAPQHTSRVNIAEPLSEPAAVASIRGTDTRTVTSNLTDVAGQSNPQAAVRLERTEGPAFVPAE